MRISKDEEAKQNFTHYLNDGLFSKTTFDKIIFDTYINNSKESLKVADKLYELDLSDLWIIVASYYSQFYIANAVLYKMGYKVGHKIAHKVTADLLRVLVKDIISSSIIKDYELAQTEALSISENLIDSYDNERLKRSKFQYEMSVKLKKSKAHTSLQRAREFFDEMINLIA